MPYCTLYICKRQGGKFRHCTRRKLSIIVKLSKDLLVDMVFQNYLSVIIPKTL